MRYNWRVRVETIRYKGVKFRRYPESEHRTERVYFTPGIADRKNGARRLHEEIWQDANGRQIPKGWHVHHRDEDPLNNDPVNLECLPEGDHQSGRHGEMHRARGQTPAGLEHMARIRPLAAEWHSSPEGLAWHSQNGKLAWARREARELTCDQCGNEYDTKSRHGTERFCSNACKSAWRRDAGLDDVGRVCPTCGDAFATNKYSGTRSCSRRCGRALITRERPVKPGPSPAELAKKAEATRAKKSAATRRVWAERRARAAI